MDVVHCGFDGQTYLAVQFAALALQNAVVRRSTLTCPQCGISAYFKKAGLDGRKAHFAAHHLPSCTGTRTNPSTGPGIGNNFVANYVIFVQAKPSVTSSAPSKTRPNAKGRRQTGGKPIILPASAKAPRQRYQVQTLLDEIKARPSILAKNSTIEIKGVVRLDAKDFFVNFNKVTPQHVGAVRGFHGPVDNVRQTPNYLFLNSGFGGISARISLGCTAELQKAYGPWSNHQWDYKTALFIGKLEQDSKGNFFVRIHAKGMLAIK